MKRNWIPFKPEPVFISTREEILYSEKYRIERAVIGALKSCIAAHGPITNKLISSAAKRIAGAVGSVVNVSERKL